MYSAGTRKRRNKLTELKRNVLWGGTEIQFPSIAVFPLIYGDTANFQSKSKLAESLRELAK